MQVIGASVDKPAANERWAQKHGLRMPLISDPEREVAAAFDVAPRLAGGAKRTTWLIDPDGTLKKVYLKVTARGHAEEVLAVVKEIWG